MFLQLHARGSALSNLLSMLALWFTLIKGERMSNRAVAAYESRSTARRPLRKLQQCVLPIGLICVLRLSMVSKEAKRAIENKP